MHRAPLRGARHERDRHRHGSALVRRLGAVERRRLLNPGRPPRPRPPAGRRLPRHRRRGHRPLRLDHHRHPRSSLPRPGPRSQGDRRPCPGPPGGGRHRLARGRSRPARRGAVRRRCRHHYGRLPRSHLPAHRLSQRRAESPAKRGAGAGSHPRPAREAALTGSAPLGPGRDPRPA